MRGYFTRLAKQSGLAIGAGSPYTQVDLGSRSSVAPESAKAPLHVETVDLVNPSAEDRGSQSLAAHWSSFERGTRDKAVSASRRRTPADINDSPTFGGETEPGGKHVPSREASDYSVSIFPDNSNQQIVQLSETKLVRQGSPHSSALKDNAGAGWPEADGTSGKRGEQRWVGKGGVVRVGERGGPVQQRLALDPDSFSEVARVLGQQGPNSSIPLDYLDDIREWLSSPPNRIEVIQSSEADANPKKAFTAFEQDVGSLVPNFSDRDPSSQNDIQEFSLSIGSISIVVEQPGQPQKDRPVSRQPLERESDGAQPGPRDTFALSRSYFRGF
jgi:hypothetical protein